MISPQSRHGLSSTSAPHTWTDAHRLVAAAHELGHAVVWKAVGFDIDEIWVRGHGPAAYGDVCLIQTEDQIRTIGQEHAVQTGLLAGEVAQHRWCQQVDTAIEFSCAADERHYRARRRSRLGRKVSRSTVNADARRLVNTHWDVIARLTPVLADSGRLSPGRLPSLHSHLTEAR